MAQVNMQQSDEQIVNNIRAGAKLNGVYIVMNILAAMLACYGLLMDSLAVVIGAMIVALLLDPIVGSSLALVEGDLPLLSKAIITEVVGIVIVYSVALIIGFFHNDMPITQEIMNRTAPNLFDLMIALVGGVAGVCGLFIPSHRSSLIGVAIATALVPPLASSAILLSRGEFLLAGGALLLAFTNIVAIQFAAFMSILYLRHNRKLLNPYYFVKAVSSNIVTMLILLALGIMFFLNLRSVMVDQAYKVKCQAAIQNALKQLDGHYLRKLVFEKNKKRLILRAVVEGPYELVPKEIIKIESQLPPTPKGLCIDFRVHFIKTTVTTSHGQR